MRGTKDEYSRICSNHAGSSSATEHFVVYNDEQLREHIGQLEYVVIGLADDFLEPADYGVAKSGSDLACRPDNDGWPDDFAESIGSADFDQSEAPGLFSFRFKLSRFAVFLVEPGERVNIGK